jgi:hypothetical protein
MHLLLKFFHLSVHNKLLFTEALFFLYLAKVMLIFCPFRICYHSIQKTPPGIGCDKVTATGIKSALAKANRLTFWKNRCMVQSVAGRWMLKRRGIASSFFIGIRHDSRKKLTAHAWLTADGLEIVPRGNGFIPVTAC